jgi:hypothetical protein
MSANVQPRFDLYRSAHKGLRKALFDAVTRIGATDFRDARAAATAAEAARVMVALSRKHIASESRFVHPAVEARAPGLMKALDHTHAEHKHELDTLEMRARELASTAVAASRLAAGARLYEAAALFAAHDLQHMAEEEQAVMPALWHLFSDDELMGIQQSIVAALQPEDLALALRPMLLAMNTLEREKMLGGLKAALPRERWDQVWALALRALDAVTLAELARSFGIDARAPLAA